MSIIQRLIEYIKNRLLWKIEGAIHWYIFSAIAVIVIVCVLCCALGYAAILAAGKF